MAPKPALMQHLATALANNNAFTDYRDTGLRVRHPKKPSRALYLVRVDDEADSAMQRFNPWGGEQDMHMAPLGIYCEEWRPYEPNQWHLHELGLARIYYGEASAFAPERLCITIMPWESIKFYPKHYQIMRAPRSPENLYIEEHRGERLVQRYESYQHYLQSQEWQEIRQSVMERARGMCEVCREAGVLRKAMDIHHVRYPKLWGQEHLTDLLAVCRAHHRLLHGNVPEGALSA